MPSSVYNSILLSIFFLVFILVFIFRTKVVTIWKERKPPKVDIKPYLDRIAQLELDKKETDSELYIMRIGEKILGYGSWCWDVSAIPDRLHFSDNFAVIFSIDKDDNFTAEELMAKIHIEDILEVKRILKEAHLSGLPYEMKYRICKLNRRLDNVKIKGEPVLSEGGKTIRIVGTIEYLSTVFD